MIKLNLLSDAEIFRVKNRYGEEKLQITSRNKGNSKSISKNSTKATVNNDRNSDELDRLS
jgi:hypothetical protein